MGLFEVRAIALGYIGVDSIVFDKASPDIFYFKHDVGAFLIVIFDGNPNVGNISDAISVAS